MPAITRGRPSWASFFFSGEPPGPPAVCCSPGATGTIWYILKSLGSSVCGEVGLEEEWQEWTSVVNFLSVLMKMSGIYPLHTGRSGGEGKPDVYLPIFRKVSISESGLICPNLQDRQRRTEINIQLKYGTTCKNQRTKNVREKKFK